jgi:TetR/AcrR family transcriptional regulator, repressor of the ameABC operon
MVLTTIQAKLDAGTRYRERIEHRLEEIIRQGVAAGRYKCADSNHAAVTVADVLACVLHPVLIARDDRETLIHKAHDIVGFVDAALQNSTC